MHLINEDRMTCGVKIYEPQYKEARIPFPNEMPWPITFVLTRYNRKHLFRNRSLPCLRSLMDDFKQFESKVRWSWFHKDSQSSSNTFWYKGKATVPCNEDCHSALLAWLGAFRSAFFSACRQSLRAASCSYAWKSNLKAIDRWGFKLLKNSDWAALPCDKEAGFACLSKRCLQEVHASILSSDRYEEISTINFYPEEINGQYVSMTKRMAEKLRLPSAAYHMRFELENSRTAVCSSLQVTVKTHKPAGEVECRGIHACHSSPFKPLSHQIVKQCRPTLESLNHIVKNSQSALHAIKSVPVSSEDYLLRLDLKDFYMSGHHHDFVESVKSTASKQNVKEALNSAMWFLLYHQYVQSPFLPGRVWKVQHGSGQGLIHSGDVTDLTYYCVVEKNLITPESLNLHAIKLYIRFRDDIFIIASESTKMWTFAKKLQRQGVKHGFKIKLESYSKQSAVMLDFEVFKGLSWKSTNKLDHKVHWKADSLLGPPLASSSAHAPHVHIAWPKAECSRLAMLSSTPTLFYEAREVLIQRIDPTNNSFLTALLRSCRYQRHQKQPKANKPCQQNRIIRLVLPFHPVVQHAGIKRLLNTFQEAEMWSLVQCAFGHQPQISLDIAWKYECPSLMRIVRGCFH